jgi:cytidylate kinase
MRKEKKGYNANDLIEIPNFRNMIPDVKDKKILDLGCGYGETDKYLKENGAAYVLGIDLSGHMIDIANKENAVIVGRCADYILRDNKDVFNVFIYSDLEKRKENIINEYGEIEDESIDKRIKEKDKKRKLYYKTYTGREFGEVKNYHIALDSSTLGIDTCVDILYSILGE